VTITSGWAVAVGTNRLLHVEVEVRVDGTCHPDWFDPDYLRAAQTPTPALGSRSFAQHRMAKRTRS